MAERIQNGLGDADEHSRNSMNDYLFTGDTHFGHANIIRYCDRPWLDRATDLKPDGKWVSEEIAAKRAAEMDEALIANWNRVVHPTDKVFHLGDFCFGRRREDFERYFTRLNGKIVFLKGNHDTLAWDNRHYFSDFHDSYAEIVLKGQRMTLCHYAMRVWNKSHFGAWHLYGHSHGSLPDDPNARSLDVGVDCHNFAPITFSQVAELMAKKNFKPIDHHTGER